MSLLVLLTPGAVFGLFWGMHRVEEWMSQGLSYEHAAGVDDGADDSPIGDSND